jgi:hypothetical protein
VYKLLVLGPDNKPVLNESFRVVPTTDEGEKNIAYQALDWARWRIDNQMAAEKRKRGK